MNHPIASHPSHPPPALSSQEQERVRDILSHRWSENTQKAYASMWRLWCSWCNQESMEPLLSEESALFRYVLHLEEEGKSYTTISNHLIAIRHGHKAKGQPLPNASDELRVFLEALRKKMRSRPKRKTPLTIERLQRALESMQLEGWERALLVWGFATGCRRSELVALRVEDIEVEEKGMRVHLRASKTNQAGKEEYISVPHEWRLVPIDAGLVRCAKKPTLARMALSLYQPTPTAPFLQDSCASCQTSSRGYQPRPIDVFGPLLACRRRNIAR